MEEEIRISEERHELQQRLDSMCQLLEKLQQAQFQRLSQPLPASLNNCTPPSEDENQMAESITENLSEIAKRVNPGDIAPVPGKIFLSFNIFATTMQKATVSRTNDLFF